MDTAILGRHRLLTDACPEQVSAQAFARIAKHQLHVRDPGQAGRGSLHHCALRRVGLSSLRFGVEALVAAQAPEDAYYLQWVLDGQLDVDAGGVRRTVDAQSAALINPDAPLRLLHSEDCRKLIVRLDRRFLEGELARLIGQPLHRPLHFAGPVCMDKPELASLGRAIRQLCQEADDPMFRFRAAYLLPPLESMLALTMLTGLAHSYSTMLKPGCEQERPAYLLRAERHIERCHADALSLDMLVRASGAGMKTLYSAFKQHHGVSPMAYLKRFRLERARQLLQAASPCQTVAEIATAVGIHHFGSFSADYKRYFGELPSTTRRCH
ncbi:MAG: AraC family transcriptional regulator [Pigmentiphaga sp.]